MFNIDSNYLGNMWSGNGEHKTFLLIYEFERVLLSINAMQEVSVVLAFIAM